MNLRYFYLAVFFLFAACQSKNGNHSASIDPWKQADLILKQIKAPTFPKRDFNITAYGAVNDGKTLCTDAIRQAITAAHAAGGGRVVIPAGNWYTGPIHLKSNVNLHVSEGATVLFSTDYNDYLPQVLTRFEGIELMNYSPLIYAYEQDNIAITGTGTLDGQGSPDHWWTWKGKWSKNEKMGIKWDPSMPSQLEANLRLRQMAAENVSVAERVFGEGDYLRPNFLQPYKCKNVLIEGLTIKNSPMWIIHPVLSENVTIRKVRVISHGPNNDGCDPESCKNVLIEDSYFDTGDDCIAIKSGRDHDARRINVPSENFIIRNCEMKDGHGGVVIGSEISANVRNIFAENCVMDSPNLDRALRIKSNSWRGGIVENIYMRNITVGEVSNANIHVDLTYDKETGDHPPIVRNILVENMQSKRSQFAVWIKGDPNNPVENIRIVDSNFENVKKENFLEGVKDLTTSGVTINGKIQD